MTAEPLIGASATLEYELPQDGDVLIAVYDVAGRRVATLLDSPQSAGIHQVSWNTAGVGNGMYFYRLQSGTTRVTRSVLVVK